MPHEQQHLQCSTFCIFHDGVATASGWSHMSGALAAPGRATAGVPRPRVDDDDEQASVAPEEAWSAVVAAVVVVAAAEVVAATAAAAAVHGGLQSRDRLEERQ